MSIPATPPSVATPPIRAVWREVYRRWGREVTSWGVYNCRPIRGTHIWSQHAWGNAWDIHGPTHLLDQIAAFLRSPGMRRWVAQVLWRVPDHFDHIHVSGRPMQAGNPPCAGGRPIRTAPVPRRHRGGFPGVTELIGGESWEHALVEAAPRYRAWARAMRGWGRMMADLRGR